LERALFEQGFEVLNLDDHEAFSYALTAHTLGAVFLYSGHPLDTASRQQLASEGRPRLLDLSREKGKFNQEELFQRALALADSLRIAKPAEHQEEVK